MKKHDEIDNPWALAWHMKNKGDKPGGKKEGQVQEDASISRPGPMAAGSSHELHEMQEILKGHGYDPKDAKKLQDEGMGTFELEHRIKSTHPGQMGSLEYTHGLKKVHARTVEASFTTLYYKLVESLRELRDKHKMDPARIAQQAVITLSREK